MLGVTRSLKMSGTPNEKQELRESGQDVYDFLPIITTYTHRFTVSVRKLPTPFVSKS